MEQEELVAEHTIDLHGCARCFGGHPNITFKRFTYPVEADELGIVYTHWALCPTNSEPILMRFVEDALE